MEIMQSEFVRIMISSIHLVQSEKSPKDSVSIVIDHETV